MTAAAAAAPSPQANLPVLRGEQIRDFLAVPAGAVRVTNIIPPAHRRVRLPMKMTDGDDTVFCFSDRLPHYDPTMHDQWRLWSPDPNTMPQVLYDVVTMQRHFSRGRFNLTYNWSAKGGPDAINIIYDYSGVNNRVTALADLHCAYCAARIDLARPNKCAQCKVARYCTREHQTAHWITHHTQCALLAEGKMARVVPSARDTGITPEAAVAMGAQPMQSFQSDAAPLVGAAATAAAAASTPTSDQKMTE